MTLLEYFGTPESALPQELIYGAMHVAEAPLVNHQRAVLKLAMALEQHVEPEGLGEVFTSPIDVILDAGRALVLQPDLLYVSRDRREIVRERIYGAPDLVIEVLSPNPRIGALRERVAWFAEYGVREIWLYDQGARQVRVLHCARGQVVSTETFNLFETLRSRVLPSFGRTIGSLVGTY